MNIYFWGVFYLGNLFWYISDCSRHWFVCFVNCVIFLILEVTTASGDFCDFSVFPPVSAFFFVEVIDALTSSLTFSLDFYTLSTVSFFCGGNLCVIFSFSFLFKRTEAWSSPTLSTLGFSFHFHSYPTQDQLKWTTYYLTCWIKNQIKLLIVLTKCKALIEGGQQLYNKNATAQGIFFIQRRNGYRTIENLVTWVPVYFYQYRAYLTTIH